MPGRGLALEIMEESRRLRPCVIPNNAAARPTFHHRRCRPWPRARWRRATRTDAPRAGCPAPPGPGCARRRPEDTDTTSRRGQRCSTATTCREPGQAGRRRGRLKKHVVGMGNLGDRRDVESWRRQVHFAPKGAKPTPMTGCSRKLASPRAHNCARVLPATHPAAWRRQRPSARSTHRRSRPSSDRMCQFQAGRHAPTRQPAGAPPLNDDTHCRRREAKDGPVA